MGRAGERKRLMSSKLWEWYRYGGRIPRKTKKKVLGSRISGCKLRRMLKETKALEPINTMYERREFTPHGAFCPNCGERDYVGTGNRASYPEHWEYFHCIRCRKTVGYIDNSPFIHALECTEDYNPVF